MTSAIEIPEADERLAAVWQVLSRLLLAAPDAATLAQVQDSDWLAGWPLAGGRTAEALALVAEPVAPIDVSDDFRQLFEGPSRHLVAPYESVHRGEDRLLFDEQTFAVREAYEAAGLRAPKFNQEPDDHIGLELEFCARLLIAGAAADHDRFCAEHLLQWAPGFAAEVIERAETGFYRGVGMLLADALEVAAAR